MTDPRQPWQPDQRKLGNWAAMFDPQARGAPPAEQVTPPLSETYDDTEPTGPDPSDYRPWILQRGRSRPALMLELRTYEPRSGLWSGILLSYPTLIAIDYTGDRLLSLDFGIRQFAIEGRGLDQLARHIQQGSVISVQEYACEVWADAPSGPAIKVIRCLTS